MLSIYANKPDGITKSLLTSKNLTNPVNVSVLTMMRGAKEVLRNGRKALACAKDSDSDYKDGTLPSGKSIADYHRFIRERMYVCLRGSSGVGDDDADDDVVLSDNQETPNSAKAALGETTNRVLKTRQMSPTPTRCPRIGTFLECLHSFFGVTT